MLYESSLLAYALYEHKKRKVGSVNWFGNLFQVQELLKKHWKPAAAGVYYCSNQINRGGYFFFIAIYTSEKIMWICGWLLFFIFYL